MLVKIILVFWAVILMLSVYTYGLSGVLATLFPQPITAETMIDASSAWLILLGPPVLGSLTRRKIRESK